LAFSDIAAEIGIEDDSNLDIENNSFDDETLDTDGGEDTGQDDSEVDNSTETDPNAFDPNTLTDPQLQAQYRQMQAAFTPKLQEAAQLRQQYGDLEPAVVEASREYARLLQTDPYAAVEYLEQQRNYLSQQLGVQQPQDPFAGVEPLTDGEARFLEVGRQMWQTIQTLTQQNQRSQFQAQQQTVERTFAQLEAQYKTTIPLEEKQKVQAEARRLGTDNVEMVWKALNFDKAKQRGADEASRSVKPKKKSPPPPQNRQQRSSTAPASTGKRSLADHFEDAWNQSGTG
jgi:hypothetical protein